MSCAQHGFVVNELSQSHLHLWQCSSLQVRVRQCVSHNFIFSRTSDVGLQGFLIINWKTSLRDTALTGLQN